jgi:hypothetical protein
VHLKRLDKPDEARNAEKVLLQAMEKVRMPRNIDAQGLQSSLPLIVATITTIVITWISSSSSSSHRTPTTWTPW